MPNWEIILEKITDMAILYMPKILLGILTLIVGLWLAKMLTKILNKSLEKAKVESTLLAFLTNIVSILLKV